MSKGKDFNDALHFCSAKGHRLMLIRDDQKMQEIMRIMNRDGIENIWLAVKRNRFPLRGPWVWKYQTVGAQPLLKSYWMDGRPNDPRGICVQMEMKGNNMTDLKRWKDVPCHKMQSFFCETY